MKVLLLGSGGLRIGQAGEFDYSGSQALKALKSESIETVLVNPNIATVQTDGDMADKVYFEPLDVQTVTKIIAREKPNGILLGFGGQTALNLGLALHENGTLKKYNVKVLGTPVSSIKITEDRNLFKRELAEIGVLTPRSKAIYTVHEAEHAAKEIGYPVMMRSGFSLGGLGSGKILDEAHLKERAREALAGAPQILIEEYLEGWKEIEYEVVRDRAGDTITVCNMENMDPMGIHTGESIVVAPSQTLTNEEYHALREIAIKTINHLGIVGECNIQYALNAKTKEYRVIEVNARLSRSSALASKATGYPLAYVATKLALGHRLKTIKNSVTGTTPAFYEPALDYVALKMPRWDLSKLKSSDRSIGSEMKSVGEVMALGRTFPEALQKAVRMLNIGAYGLFHPSLFDVRRTSAELLHEIKHATDRRLFVIYEAMKRGTSVETIQKLSHIDPWFLCQLQDIAKTESNLRKPSFAKASTDAPSFVKTTEGEKALADKSAGKGITNYELLDRAKKMGFSDKMIGNLTKMSEERVRATRIKMGIVPVVKQIDTLAGEFSAETNYLYMTYHGTSNDVQPLSKTPSSATKKPVIILGSGPYAIGSSVEFDWCAVNTAKTLRAEGTPTIMVNSNPETVSTDFDRSDRLYFEELTFERIQDIADFEKHRAGIVVSVGGQIANNVALPLHRAGYRILGTPAESIDRAENREKFSRMLHELGIDQPEWEEVTDLRSAKAFAKKTGYPALIRPSYVLSGGAMNVVSDDVALERYLSAATRLSPDHPVVISKFIANAKELEIDGVAEKGRVVIYAISEHVENAGVHSGDATIVLPPQRLYLETIRRAKRIAKQIVKALKITGPFNVQFIAKDNQLKVIECNVRASRSFPFVSKVTNHNFIQIATEAMMGKAHHERYETVSLDYVGVKSPQFSYHRLKGADPVAGVEMASTGEVACLGDDLNDAFLASWFATEKTISGKKIFVSIDDDHKHKFVDEMEELHAQGWKIYATGGTHDYLKERGIPSERLYRVSDNKEPSVTSAIKERKFDLAINIPSPLSHGNSDSGKIRRLAIDSHIPLVTNAEIGSLLLRCLAEANTKRRTPKSWQEFMKRRG
jgi:carbamoyl-phosphate synthase large subunit